MKQSRTTLISILLCLFGTQMAHAENGIIYDGESLLSR